VTEAKAGSRWRSAVCDTEVVVVRAATTDVELGCGGQPLVPLDAERPAGLTIDAGLAEGSPVGKRYADAGSGVEVLVTKAGAGSLTVDGRPIPRKDAKPLPSSD
jgi:hypothetical protein